MMAASGEQFSLYSTHAHGLSRRELPYRREREERFKCVFSKMVWQWISSQWVHQIGWNLLRQFFKTVWSVTTLEVGGIVDQTVQGK
jgi:hypothetical protein